MSKLITFKKGYYFRGKKRGGGGRRSGSSFYPKVDCTKYIHASTDSRLQGSGRTMSLCSRTVTAPQGPALGRWWMNLYCFYTLQSCVTFCPRYGCPRYPVNGKSKLQSQTLEDYYCFYVEQKGRESGEEKATPSLHMLWAPRKNPEGQIPKCEPGTRIRGEGEKVTCYLYIFPWRHFANNSEE